MSSSFLQAFWDKESGAISWEEYIHYLCGRWAGTKYEEDEDEMKENDILFDDPFGHYIWCAGNRLEPMKDTSQVEAVFRACHSGTLDDVKHKFAQLQGPVAEEVHKALAFLALQERRPEVLKYCFDHGAFPFEFSFHQEVDMVDPSKDPETFKVVEESKFREYWPRKKKDQKDNIDPDDWKTRAAMAFDKGGKYPVAW